MTLLRTCRTIQIIAPQTPTSHIRQSCSATFLEKLRITIALVTEPISDRSSSIPKLTCMRLVCCFPNPWSYISFTFPNFASILYTCAKNSTSSETKSMTNNFPSPALKGRQYVSPGRSFALRSAGLGSSQFSIKSTVAPAKSRTATALRATLLETPPKYLDVLVMPPKKPFSFG
jgi:hypothetical protein